MRIIIGIILFTTFTAFSQNDTISGFRVRTMLASLTNTSKYYAVSQAKYDELIKNKKNTLFAEKKDWLLIEKGIVKSGNCFKHIQNGILIKKECRENPKDKLCLFDIPYYDKDSVLTKK